MMATQDIKINDSVIYAETGCQTLIGTVTEFDPITNIVELTDLDGKVRIELDLVYWFIVEPADEEHP